MLDVHAERSEKSHHKLQAINNFSYETPQNNCNFTVVSRQCVHDDFLERSADYVLKEITCRLLKNCFEIFNRGKVKFTLFLAPLLRRLRCRIWGWLKLIFVRLLLKELQQGLCRC